MSLLDTLSRSDISWGIVLMFMFAIVILMALLGYTLPGTPAPIPQPAPIPAPPASLIPYCVNKSDTGGHYFINPSSTLCNALGWTHQFGFKAYGNHVPGTIPYYVSFINSPNYQFCISQNKYPCTGGNWQKYFVFYAFPTAGVQGTQEYFVYRNTTGNYIISNKTVIPPAGYSLFLSYYAFPL